MTSIMIPAIYEIDTEISEANGIVHTFCGEPCREKARVDIAAEVRARGFDPVDGMTDALSLCEGTVCEWCLICLGETAR